MTRRAEQKSDGDVSDFMHLNELITQNQRGDS
jgi:hypothetical protein